MIIWCTDKSLDYPLGKPTSFIQVGLMSIVFNSQGEIQICLRQQMGIVEGTVNEQRAIAFHEHKLWHQLQYDVIHAPFLVTFKKRLNKDE